MFICLFAILLSSNYVLTQSPQAALALLTGTGGSVSMPSISQLSSQITQGIVNWFDTKFQAKDIAMSPEGFIWAVGLDSQLYSYNDIENTYNLVKGNSEMDTVQRLAVDVDGKPFVITTSGSIYNLDCENNWVKLPGCGRDIAISRDNEIWKIGCDAQPNADCDDDSDLSDYGVWKLFCTSNTRCACGRKCITFRKDKVNRCETNTPPTCEWIRVPGQGVRIAVKADGDPVVIDKQGRVIEKSEEGWKLLDGVLGVDVATSNTGDIFVAGQQQYIFKKVQPSGKTCSNGKTQWLKIQSQGAIAIASGPFSELVQVTTTNDVQTVTKLGFN